MSESVVVWRTRHVAAPWLGKPQAAYRSSLYRYDGWAVERLRRHASYLALRLLAIDETFRLRGISRLLSPTMREATEQLVIHE